MTNPRSARVSQARLPPPPAEALRAVQQRSRATRDGLLAAGRALLATHDFDSLSVADLAAANGMSVGSFYGRFRDKASFFAVLQQQVLAQWSEMVDSALTPVRSGRLPAHAAVQAVCTMVVDGFRADAGFFRAALKQAAAEPGRWTPVKEAGITVAQDCTDALAPLLPHLQADDCRRRLRFAFQMMYGTCANAVLHDPGPITLADPRLAPALAEVFCAHLQIHVPPAVKADSNHRARRGHQETHR